MRDKKKGAFVAVEMDATGNMQTLVSFVIFVIMMLWRIGLLAIAETVAFFLKRRL